MGDTVEACGEPAAPGPDRGHADRVLVVEVLERMGGVATRRGLVRATDRAAVEAAIAGGEIVKVARGRYATATADEALVAALRLTGTATRWSAALHHGWAVKTVPRLPHVAVPKNRRLAVGQAHGVELHRVDLADDDVDGLVTSPERTLLDCLRAGPFDAALCVADSALREGFSPARLAAIARDARGPGAVMVRQVARRADGRAANAFESTLRAIALSVDGLDVVPQRSIREPHFLGRPDLVDERLRIVLEADSFEWHGGRAALRRDARRYNAFSVHGWLVLRFAWEDVMFEPELVRQTIIAAVEERTERACRCRPAA